MTKEIVTFDLETTGLDVKNDQIIQIGLIKFNSTTFEEIEHKMYFVKPKDDYIMSEEAISKHGVTKEYLDANGVYLTEIWQECKDFIGNCDMLSYNGNHFDVPMLYYNLQRNNLDFDFASRNFYDSMVIERKIYSMKLGDIYKRYTNKELDNAHDAFFDTKATVEVFKHQFNKNREIIEETNFKLLSLEDFLKYDNNNELVFKNGKYRDKRTNDICKTDPKYIKWVFSNFSEITRKTIMDEYYKAYPKKQ